jgi:acetyl-CoA C-acetyltransferase
MPRDVFVIGCGRVSVTRGVPQRLTELGVSAVHAALADSGSPDVDALYVGNMTGSALSNQSQVAACIAEKAELSGISALTLEAACAAGGAAIHAAYTAVAGGLADVAVCCGVEILSHVDRATSSRALATASAWEREGGRGDSFISLNARVMREYMQRYGVDDAAFAPFAIAAHRNACDNPAALYQKPIELGDYLGSRLIEAPVRLYDASPICDGAAAAVIACGRVARDLKRDGVRIVASSVATDRIALGDRDDMLELSAARVSCSRAYEQAQVGPGDVDLFELHDAFTVISVLSLEAAGFALPGCGHRLGDSVGRDGSIPISTLGGLKARGHPVGASGVYQLVEACSQLRSLAGSAQVAGAKTAMIQNLGGVGTTAITHILQRVA